MEIDAAANTYGLEDIISAYSGILSAKKILAVYRASGSDTQATAECLATGPTLSSLLKMLRKQFDEQPAVKLTIDPDDAWADTVTFYKSRRFDPGKRVRVQVEGQPALDTGGVRAQLYSTVFQQFAQNKQLSLFDGPDYHLRPMCTAQARSSGLFRVLGTMVAHSIVQNGVGFPYLSPVCYWYIADGEERSLQHLSTVDISLDAAHVVDMVSMAEKCTCSNNNCCMKLDESLKMHVLI